MTHAKAILFGEHSVVYEKLGISIPLKEMNINVEFDNITNKNFEQNNDVIKNILKLCEEDENKKCIITSNIPIGKGLGSSAALAVDFAKKLNKDIYKIATLSEEFVHFTSSGIDLEQVISDVPLMFMKNKFVKEFSFNLNTKLLIIDTNVIGSTKKAVSLVNKNYEKNIYDIEKLGEISLEAVHYLKTANLKKIGELMYKAHNHLSKIQVSHFSNDKIVQIAKENNILGAKLTGGGLGGCCIALCKNQKECIKLKKIYKEKGYNSWIISI